MKTQFLLKLYESKDNPYPLPSRGRGCKLETKRPALAVGQPWYHDDPESINLFTKRKEEKEKAKLFGPQNLLFISFSQTAEVASYLSFLENPVPGTDFIRLRVGKDAGSLN